METQFKNLTHFFNQTLQDLPCRHDTKTYIISIYSKYKNADSDLSKDSITLLYALAKEKQDFATFQNIGDWIFFSKTFYPTHLNNASEDYYHTVGRLSYYSCYKLINKKWPLYEQLADEFVPLIIKTKNIIASNVEFNIAFR